LEKNAPEALLRRLGTPSFFQNEREKPPLECQLKGKTERVINQGDQLKESS